MKKLTAGVLGAALALGIPLFAQDAANADQANSATTQAAPDAGTAQGKPYGHRHRGGMKKMAEKLNLTADQQAKLKPIFQQAHAQAKTIRQDTSLTQEQKRAKMKDLHQTTMAQLNEILTPEQQTQLKQLQEQRRAQWQQRHQQMQQQQQSAPQSNTPQSSAPQGE
ncbi:MAG TPA: hypothetical protein VKW78_07560 [Terriglobales bacterium]|nr:hypothetical protein [Terriglobales bacterium]